MKNGLFKKSMSVFLSILMLMTCWVWIAPTQAEAASKTINLSALTVISNGSGDRASGGKIVVCSDGYASNTTVGVLKFDISGLPATVTNATFNVNIGNHGGYIPSHAKFYLVDPSKCTDATAVVQTVNKISAVYNNNYSSTTGASNAYSYFGISESQALDTVYQNATGVKTFDITNTVNTAKARGWSDLCLVFIMPKAFSDNGSTGWSDLHIYSSNTNLVCEYEGAYGMPQASYADNRTGYIQSHQRTDGTDYLDVYYPEEIYLDKSENLETAGYKVYLSGHYGSNDGYRTLAFSTIWGGSYDRENGALKNTTMLDMFDNYTYYTSDEVSVYSGKENYNVDGSNWVVNFKGTSSNNGVFSATVNLQGTPKADKIGTEATFDAANNNTATPLVSHMEKKNWLGNWNDSAKAWMNAGDVTDVVKIKVTLYDKEALNQTYQKSVQIYNINAPYGDYITGGLDTYLGYHETTTPNLLKTRKTNQTAINNERTGFENAIKGLVFNADNSALVTAMNNAKAIIDEADYTKKYTAASRTDLEAAYNNAVNSVYDTSVPKYQITNLGDNSTWNAGEKAADDQTAINKLTNAINDVVMELQEYSVTFNYNNGSSDTQAYDYGTTITAPANSTKAPDATNHYTYIWSPAVATTVTGDATYNEVLSTEAHQWTITDNSDSEGWVVTVEPSCTSEGSATRTCSVASCGYTETKILDKATHNLVAVDAVAATCTATGKIAYWYCDDCSKLFKDASASTEITNDDLIAPAKGHNFEGAVKANSDYTHSFKCTDCDAYGTGTRANGDATEGGTEACLAYYGDTYINVEGGEDGTHKQQCSVCKQYSATAAHTWDNGYVSKTPSCSEEGEKTYTCTATGCGAKKTTPLDMTAHTWTEKVYDDAHIKAAGTCTAEAVYYYDCAVCDAIANDDVENGTYIGEKDATNHTGKADVVKNATPKTCTTNGYTGDTYWSCCDTIAAQGETIPAGHEWSAWTQYNSGSTHRRTCSVCNNAFEEGNHSYTEDPKPVTMPGSTGHYHNYKCELCEARGIMDGSIPKQNIGTACYQGDEATYTEKDGSVHTVDCVCGNTKEEGHWWTVTDQKAATCDEEGYKTSECDYCKAVKTETLLAAHTPGEAVKENRIEATCTVDGSYNLVVRCTVCKEIISSEPKTITAEGHKFSEIVAANAATCAKEGNEAYKTCTVCNKYFAADADVKSEDAKDSADAFTIKIDSTNHENTTVHAETPATCVAEGTIEYWSCSDCGKNFSDEACTTEVTDLTIKMLDHSYTGEIKSDGNGEDATHSFMCVNGCDQYGGAVTHTWGTGVENPEANCENAGTMTYACTVEGCGATYTETVNPDGHDYGEWIKEVPATCVAAGTKGHYECSVCHKYFAEDKTTVIDNLTLDIDPDAHDIVNHDEKAPTCTEKGWFAYDTCSRCDYTTYEERDPINHAYGNWTYVADGKHQRVCANDSSHVETEACADSDDNNCNCDKCGELVKHTPAAAVQEGRVEATCGKAGSYNSVVYCSVCKEELSSTVEVIPATGKHTYGAFAHVENTSTHAKTCSVCGGVVTENCTAGDWVTDVNATCMEVGSKYKQCTVCKDEMERENIPMTAHNFGGEIKNSKDGYHVYKCTNILNTNVSCSEYGNEEACSGGTATCTAKPVCEKCNTVYGSALGHDFATTFTVDVKASCFNAGSKSKHCSRCEATTDVTEIPVRPHNIVDNGIATPATCTTNGVMNQKCDNAETDEYVACDYVTTREIKAAGHKFSETVAANAATCAKEGNEAYKTCTVCNKFFAADADKMSEAANDSADAFTIAIAPEAHDWDEGVVTTEPKCETPGEKTFTCNNDPSHTRTEPVTALGHIDVDPVDGKCDRCGADICKHTDVTKTERKEATCIAEGNIQYWTCNICKKNFSDEELKTVVTNVVIGIDKTNHDGDTYTQDEDIVLGTCISEKTWNEVTYCSDCNAKLGSEAKKGTIDSNNHVGDTYTQDENIVLGTCISEKTWNEVTYCSDCNAKLGTEAKTGSKDADAHKAEAEYIQTIAPTCSAAGEEKLYCEYCDAVLDTREVAIVADAHKAEAEYIQTIAPTCSAVGEEKLYCEYCDAVLDTREVAIVADAHKAETAYTVIKKANCEADGYKAILCEYCDAELSKETIAKREHNLIDVAQTAAPTCTTPGTMSQRCDNVGTDEYEACAYTATREIAIDANAHDWNNWSVKTPATCVAEGERTRVCKNDSNHVERESIAINKNNHAGLVKVGAKAAACEEIGWDAYEYCTECDYTTYVEIPALEHDYEGVVTKEETCTEDGIITYTCKNDATHTYIEVIPAHHTDADDNGYCDDCNELVCAHTDTRLENVQAVTCLTEGYSGDEICNKCGNEIAKGHAIPATGHNYGEEPFKVINASCTSGKISIYRCDNCYETYSVTDEGEDALEPHTIVEIKEVEPTCDKMGFYVYYCTTCSTNVEVVQIPATGHVDANQDGVCDKVGCGGKVEIPGGSKACSCICHKEGWFMQLIYKIFRFFWKLFGIGKTCDCGFVHY